MAALDRLLAGSATPWAVVVENGVAEGWVMPRADATGTVADHLRLFASRIPLGASLHTALAELLQHDAPAIPVFNGNTYLGLLTFEQLHAAMRRSLPEELATRPRSPCRRLQRRAVHGTVVVAGLAEHRAGAAHRRGSR